MKCTPGPLVASCSGSIGGQTFSRNKGGAYVRTRAVPTNPQTPRQVNARQSFTEVSQKWHTLFASERSAWDAFAPTVPATDPLGQSVTLSGQQAYMQASVPVKHSKAVIPPTTVADPDFPPTSPTGSPTSVSPTAAAATQAGGTYEITFVNTDAWANSDNGALMVFQGQPAHAGKRPQDMPMRFVGSIQGDSTTPPTSPVVLATNWPWAPTDVGNLFVVSTRTLDTEANMPGQTDSTPPIVIAT